ncbi:acyl-CoA/acyl-ACP dehydrogenase [Amycolatopsis acidiphila]|uniref:Acyl-CoA dehydrogenase n=1 Tax=Amycolatopsis acidiphila TaxID=715473 RepID=A0A558AA19_9PSEU|nr:acyl-CoA dehydrogenase family protein [Amycolatopsis acidiphila]TVT21107.1 acyl-CoA dehydrogenase [Amycolatopsis acidiphila]UIJ57188.1 acyl-CoA/acyl-ACP dehydrogenase [Amycolatopsis acidiphila]GHG52796.1 acyl-CoA dehydrogenase [Amycolatopsis acidiphila]
MEFRFDPEHLELQRTVRRFLTEVSPEARMRADAETAEGWDSGTWRRLCAELELTALAVPERYGGHGFGLTELGIAFAEAGASLLCAPLLSTSLAARAILESGDEEAAGERLPGLAAGTVTGTLAAHEPGRGWDDPLTRAVRTEAGWTVTGHKNWVLDGHTAGLFVVSAATDLGPALFLVDGAAPGLRAAPVDTVDPTRKAAALELSAVPATPLGAAGAALRRTLDAGLVLLAAEQTGLARRCLDMAGEYARQREQFGRPIGMFQAVKHKLANVLLEVEAATSAMMYALWAADHQPAELPAAAAIAASTCAEAALLAAGENIQVHGGMGVTWEHPAHLYLKRATTSRLLLGDPQQHLERLAVHIGLGGLAAPDGTSPHPERQEDAWQDGWKAKSPS